MRQQLSGECRHACYERWRRQASPERGNARPASIEAEMRVALKQWLRSHWNEMSAGDRAKFPAQTLFLSPAGGGIAAMREKYEHWLQILMAVTGFVLLIVCANVANLMLVRGMERRRQTSLSLALGARTSRIVRQVPPGRGSPLPLEGHPATRIATLRVRLTIG